MKPTIAQKPKKCEVCKKIIRNWNKNNLCSHHYILDNAKQRKIEKIIIIKNKNI